MKYNQEKLLYCLAFIGFLLGILYDANITSFGMGVIHKIIYSLFSWSNNLFMKGIPYVATGYYVRKHVNEIKRCGLGKAILLYVAASIGMIMIYNAGFQQWLCLYPIQAISLLLICCQDIKCPLNQHITKNCRNLSSVIYFLHTVFIYGVVDSVWGIDAAIALKFFVSIALSIIVYWIAKTFKIKSLNWLLAIR